MNPAETRWGTAENAEAIQAWDGPLFDRWIKFRHIVTTGLGVDAASDTGAFRVYERAGMAPFLGWVTYEKELGDS